MVHPRYDGPVIDVHTHVDGPRVDLVDRIMDVNGIARIVNLWNLAWPPPDFDRWRAELSLADKRRMVLYHTPNLSRLAGPDFERFIVDDIQRAAANGAAGIKVWKNLGLRIVDEDGRLAPVDDPRLNPLWETAGATGLPISIHIADPVAFFQPLNERNERHAELAAHPDWWFGGPGLPSFPELLAQCECVVADHAGTTFIGVHMGCYAEDLGFVGRMLDAYPNYYVDTSARISEFGRHGASAVRDFFTRYASRILFGSDLVRTAAEWLPDDETYEPTLASFYDRHWRYFETDEKSLPHPFPVQGDWTVDGINLSRDVLEQVYYTNARRVIPALAM